ncbi:MAG: DUF86 domain-containing protein [Phycisphaeraceae bacterium]|nr:DUF86 domain-containing protein [Phycisphaeraceae bacterium]
MSPDPWHIRVDHMLEAVERIETAVRDMDFDAFAASPLAQDAVFWNFHVLGEAVRHVPDHVRQRHPDVPWLMIRSLRNVIVHHYEGIKLDLIWGAILELPHLKLYLESLRDS